MKDERGMTLVEILVALAITALITGILVTAIYQIYQVTGWGNNEMRVQHDLQNAATWLNRDVVSASSAEVTGSQMVLTIPYFSAGDISTRTITYTHPVAGGVLTRDSVTSTVTVARHVDSVAFSATGTVTSTITITITSQASDVTQSAT
ncbi:MAG: prepilin-type N-terminal cleavage/methylation domain-containing protein, partial [Chloroflexota bacterium]|nr:prepilin-type N-terminal cleavage/methylation domain-containing protein [Chloroflexota bacterium]